MEMGERMNYKLTIEYDGSRYEGWQRQKKTMLTIQGKLEDVLSRMEGRAVEIQGAGRTDAGVHAKGQVASVYLERAGSCKDILEYMNRYLPEDIGVTAVKQAPERFHARLSAVGKRYRYRIGTDSQKLVFERKYRYPLGRQLDVCAMRQAAETLVGTRDFKTFCGNPHMKKSTVRTITAIDIQEYAHEIQLVFEGDGFLQYMVRILTGTLIETGLHQRPADTMESLLAGRDRQLAGVTAPAQGLCLEKVFYPG